MKIVTFCNSISQATLVLDYLEREDIKAHILQNIIVNTLQAKQTTEEDGRLAIGVDDKQYLDAIDLLKELDRSPYKKCCECGSTNIDINIRQRAPQVFHALRIAFGGEKRDICSNGDEYVCKDCGHRFHANLFQRC